ncbi:MAG: hypothetical protein LBF19_04455 [Prevotellaceae bacterium]|jgi:hypothetical protein|nr:hypothetical protein [Prevotellaceae bacterium]
MKRNILQWSLWIAVAALLLPAISCSEKEKEYTGEPYFYIEGNPTAELVGTASQTIRYVVRSNRPWKIVPQSEGTWVRPFPNEGELDGIFKIIISENRTIDVRQMNFELVVDGKPQPTLLHVEQEAADAALTLTPSPTVSVLSNGGVVTVNVAANIEWNYTLTNGHWLQQPQVDATSVTFTAEANETGAIREAILTVTPADAQYAALAASVTIRQLSIREDDNKAIGYVYFEDDFSWVIPFNGPADIENWNNDESATVAGTHNIYTYANSADGIAAGDLLAAFLAQGYTDPRYDGTNDSRIIYFAAHYLKFGKTGYHGKLQRQLTQIDPDKFTNVLLTFDATPCKTNPSATGNNYDDVFLRVVIEGSGSVGVDDGTTKVGEDIDIQLVDKSRPWVWHSKNVVLYGVAADTRVTIQTNMPDSPTGDGLQRRWYFDNLKFAKHSAVTP